MTLQAYACRLSCSSHETIINASSRGKAKSDFLNRLDLAEACFKDVRARRVGGPVTTADLVRTAKYRGVPFVRAGMRVKVGDAWGLIVGSNSAANFDVQFDSDSEHRGETLNCHPNWKITYFDDDGSVLASF